MQTRRSPLITIGLPVYNGMPYLPASLESLLNQTRSEFCILAIDDGSTDNSLEYLRSVKDARLRILTQENRGLTSTLNRMFAEMESPWLMRHDADDIAYPQRVERTLEYIERFPEAGMFYSMAEYGAEGRKRGTFPTSKGTPEELRQIVKAGYLLSLCHITATLNIEKARAVGGYRFDLHVEDIDLWWRMALQHNIQFIPHTLSGIRQNLSSVSSQNLRGQAVNTLYIQYLLMCRLEEREPKDYSVVKADLDAMLDIRKLRFRQELRLANILASEKAVLGAGYHAIRAFLQSPRAFSNRILYECSSKNRDVRVGENPKAFYRTPLWA